MNTRKPGPREQHVLELVSIGRTLAHYKTRELVLVGCVTILSRLERTPTDEDADAVFSKILRTAYQEVSRRARAADFAAELAKRSIIEERDSEE